MFNVQFASKAAYSISCTQEHLWFQDEEIEALAAIYGDDWEVVDSESRKYHIRISDEKLKNAILMEVCIKKKPPHKHFSPIVHQKFVWHSWIKLHLHPPPPNSVWTLTIMSYFRSILKYFNTCK